ncbi:MAG: zinc-ribbon domain-containing protein, partial [Plesiomonas sp.]
ETKADVKFIMWDGDFIRSASKAFVRCNVDGHEWSVRINDVVTKGSGCPKCANNYRYTLVEYVKRVNDRDNCDNSFVRIIGKFKGSATKVMMKCDVDGHQWVTTFKNILGRGTGCPVCTNHGFDPDKPAMLYALQSRCGTMVKIGITNDYPRRYTELVRATPFEFDKVEMLEGEGVVIQNLEKALHHTMEAVNFIESFSGHTEWMLWDPRLHDWFEFYRKLLNL